MRITLTLPDELVAEFEPERAEMQGGKGIPLEAYLLKRLQKLSAVRLDDRYVVVSPDTRAQLEAILGGLPLRDQLDLLSRVKELSGISFGHVRLGLTALQLAEVKGKAERWGISPAQYLEKTVRRILEAHILSTVPQDGEMLAAGGLAAGAATATGKGAKA